MISVQLMSPIRRWRATKYPTFAIERESARSQSAKVTAQFQPLDPGIVNDEIPAFFIGRNMEGFWVARDARGQIGGIFLLETSALSFAKKNSEPAGCATIFPSERFELDLENSGNPFVVHVGALRRLALGHGRKMITLIAKMTEAAKRRLNDLHLL